VRRLPDFATFDGEGEVQAGTRASPCEITVDPSGLTVTEANGTETHWPAHDIAGVTRSGYEVIVRRALGRGSTVLTRFARRTDELIVALRRCRADALARLMAPPDESPRETTEAVGAETGFLYRYDDGLRWVPDAGVCFARLYGELDGLAFAADRYELTLTGPLGESRVSGLRRLAREVGAEAARRIDDARQGFARALETAGLPWADDAAAGRIRQHVPFAPGAEQVVQAEGAGELICEERRGYWAVLRDAGVIRRLVVSAGAEGEVRPAALCPVARGELYELLSEADHASFVFARADDAVRAWTEVGFRREPVFAEKDAENYCVLAARLPSLRAAREGLRQRVVHDEPADWWKRLSD